MIEVVRYAGAAAFLADAEAELMEAEVENGLILGLARGLRDAATDPLAAPYFAAVRDQAGLCVAAFQTLAPKLGLTRARRLDAVPLLAADVHAACPSVADIIGPEPTAGAFSAHLASLRGGSAELRMRQRIYSLREVIPLPTPPPGRFRQADADDAELLIPWAAGFFADIGDIGDPDAAVHDRVARGQLFVWDHDGPRAMAAWTGKTATTVRIGFVYTPPALRARGYASGVVGGLSQYLLDQGNEHCVLYTDLGNPTSNAIYQRIGYRPVTDVNAYRLAVSSGSG